MRPLKDWPYDVRAPKIRRRMQPYRPRRVSATEDASNLAPCDSIEKRSGAVRAIPSQASTDSRAALPARRGQAAAMNVSCGHSDQRKQRSRAHAAQETELER